MTDTFTANALSRAIPFSAGIGVGRVEGMPVLALSLRRVQLKLVAMSTGVVDLLGHRFQMGSADAVPGAAEVVDGGAFGDRPMLQFVRETVSKNQSLSATADAKHSVPVGHGVCSPQPALTGLIDLRPEPLLGGTHYQFRPTGGEWVAVALKPAVVHLAPTTFFNGFRAFGNGACHMSKYTPYPEVA